MKFNWRAFVFSLGVLLFALIAVNLVSSGVKMEGFEEGAATKADTCSQALSSDKENKKRKPAPLKIDDLKKAIDNKKKDVWNGNNIDYNKLPDWKKYQGNCDLFIKEYAGSPPKQTANVSTTAKPVAAAKKK